MFIKLPYCLIVLYLPLVLSAQPRPVIEEYICPNKDNGFRAISALDEQSLWLASDNGQVWFFNDKRGWRDCSPQYFEDQIIMWRDIHAYDDSTVLILSAGSPGLILRTEDAGSTWEEVYRDDSPAIFFDAFGFHGPRGLAFSDAQGKYLGMIETRDSGKTWQPWAEQTASLQVIENQGGFAASGSCLKMIDSSEVVIVLGGAEATFKRIGFEQHFNRPLPLDAGASSKGAFSIAFKNSDSLIAVGGDYHSDSLSTHSVALSFDGGNSWQLADRWPKLQNAYWSAVSWDTELIVLCSRFKTALSSDGGANWQIIDQGFYAYDKGWFSGPYGRIGRLKTSSE